MDEKACSHFDGCACAHRLAWIFRPDVILSTSIILGTVAHVQAVGTRLLSLLPHGLG